ncbi:hypothetical protein LWC34_46425 [Kibdelosporangium philippinense]|uniref:Tachylectin n=1 Tax=Kibdelosporangium philippinense TaxID=211113 RepID=A0ABS8ZRF7_9PSEU|nr:tachylectin-related carbohydrate-binding protein [Kibdelosporangium philippinense]MCE7010192.1 hypothetical protein [Kibdelosporangium philippinense]
MAAVSVVATQANGQAAPTFTCNTAANVFSVRPGGGLYLYPHEEPETGVAEWGTVNHIGSGWDDAKALAAPNGVMYLLSKTTGQMFRYRYNGTGWDSWGGDQSRLVGSGWARHATDATGRNQVTVDEKGRLYHIDAEGRLRVFEWIGDNATGKWSAAQVLDTGWAKYNLIVAAGDGVLYARETDGELYRYRWDANSDRFTQYGKLVGSSWNAFTRIASAGADVLYGVRAAAGGGVDKGDLLWYRYHEDTNTWDARKVVGSGWDDELDVVADPNACRITGFPRPVQPLVVQRHDGANTAVQGSDGFVTFFYVNTAGQLTAAKQRNPGDYDILEYQVIANVDGFNGKPGAAVRADNKLEVLANSYNLGTYRGRVQPTANGTWEPISAVSAYRGWMISDPVIVREPNKSLTTYAVDSAGALWRKANDLSAWRQISAPVGLTADFTAILNGTAVDIVARTNDGTIQTATYAANALSAWRTIGTNGTGRPSAVAHVNGDLQVFVRTADGVISTQRETNNTFPQTWQAIPGLTAIGSPAAALRTSGLIDIAARGENNLVHQTSQVAPAGGFGDWKVWHVEEAATDPSSLLLTNGTPIFTWRSPNGTIQTVKDRDVTARTFTGQTGESR